MSCDHRDPPRDVHNGFVERINEYLKDEQIRYICVENGKWFKTKLRKESGEYIKEPSCEETTNIIDRDKELERIRNRFIDRAILGINANYNDFVVALAERRSTGNFIADLAQITLSSIIGVVDNTSTSQILGVSLSGFTAARASYDLNFYQEQATPVLIGAMDAGRSRILAIISQKKKQSVYQYSLHAAINDIVDYYNAGTIIRAFVELNRDTAVQARNAEIRVLQSQGVDPPFSEVPTQEEKPTIDKAIEITDAFEKAYIEAIGDEVKFNKINEDFTKIINELNKNPAFSKEWEKLTGNHINDFEKFEDFKRFLLGFPNDYQIQKNSDLVLDIEKTIIEVYPQGYSGLQG